MTKQFANTLIHQLWLEYFNRVLFQQGIICEKSYRLILLQICNKYTSIFSSRDNTGMLPFCFPST